MKYIFTLSLLWLCFGFVTETMAQDTTVVQTFTFDNASRDQVFEFPDDGKTYRQILMEYSLRCYEAGINQGSDATGIGCREWDYSCNTILTDSSTLDSIKARHPDHLISNFSGDNFEYTTQPTYTYQQKVQKEVSYEEVISENTGSIGEGNESITHLNTGSTIGKVQYLYRGDELLEAGLVEGGITGMQLDLSEIGGTLDFLKIRIRRFINDELEADNIYTNIFTEVYFLNTTIEATGWQQFNFYQPYEWDGDDDIIVELSYQNAEDAPTFALIGHETDFNSAVYTTQADYFTRFSGNNEINLPENALEEISEQISISFWAYGDSILPVNSTIFEGTDTDGLRQANVHLPWSNSRVYWDCGNDGLGYDRVDRAAGENDIKQNWVHWAFTKNTETGELIIYKNGAKWKIETDKLKLIDIVNFKLGRSIVNNYPWYGNINEFAIWKAELDNETIQAWMYKDIDETHPFYDDLMVYYPFDETEGNAVSDASPNEINSEILNGANWGQINAHELYRHFEADNLRPNIAFLQGEYVSSIQEFIFIDSMINPLNSVQYFEVEGTDLVETGSDLFWQAGYTYVFNEAADAIIDSVWNETEDNIEIGTLDYYTKSPSRYELTSFVTPYGFFLDLGPEGKTWTMDVSDFATVLKGNKRISVVAGGQNQTEMDIRFLFIEGTPPREAIEIKNVWSFISNRSYPSIVNDEYFEPRQVSLNPEASQYKIRLAQTGHGSNGEFIPQNHFVNINGGEKEFTFEGWKDCGENPIYPQGGTWIFDRAGWCPGMETDIYHFELTDMVASGETVEIDYGIEETADMSQANYRVAAQLVSYGAPNFAYDANIVEVKKPSNRAEYLRFNPSCSHPIVVLQNTGSDELTSVIFDYYVDGGEIETWTWNGSLNFLEKEEIVLPISGINFWFTENENAQFHVKIANDDNPDNNHYISEFDIPAEQPNKFIINLKTDNRAAENSYTIKDLDGNIILERSGLENNTEYNDDLELTANGCYSLEIKDEFLDDELGAFIGEDGLDFWLWNNPNNLGGFVIGTGYLRLKDSLENVTQTFEPDFGASLKYDFSFYDPALEPIDSMIVDTMVTDTMVIDTMINGIDDLGYRLFSTYPNPTKDLLNVELHGFANNYLDIQLFNTLGQVVYQEKINANTTEFIHQISTKEWSNGVYLLKMEATNGRSWTKRILKE